MQGTHLVKDWEYYSADYKAKTRCNCSECLKWEQKCQALEKLNDALCQRVAAQAELLGRRSEKPVCTCELTGTNVCPTHGDPV